MMHSLEMPDDFACRSAEGNYGIRVVVTSETQTPVVVRARRAGWDKYKIALWIGCDHGPRVRCSSAVGGRALPRFEFRVRRILGHRIPAPFELTGARIVCPDLTAGGGWSLVVCHRGTDDDDPVAHGGRGRDLILGKLERCVAQSFA